MTLVDWFIVFLLFCAVLPGFLLVIGFGGAGGHKLWRLAFPKAAEEQIAASPAQMAAAIEGYWQSRAAKMQTEAARWQAKHAQVCAENNALRRRLYPRIKTPHHHE